MRALLLSASMAVSSSAALAEPAPGQIIWSDIQYGMTKEQVRALHPKGKAVDLGNGCSAWLQPEYEGKNVVEVKLGGSSDGGCDTNALASLKAKHGEPRSTEVDVVQPDRTAALRRYVRLRQLGRKGDELFDTIRTRTWFTGNTLVTLKMNETVGDWNVLYQPAEIKKPALTDKL